MKKPNRHPKIVTFFLLILSFCFIACSKPDQASTSPKNVLAALVIDGSINDESFNQSAWMGMLRAEEKLAYKVAYRETKQASEYVAAFDSLLALNPSIVLGIGYKLEDETVKQAKLNPSIRFASIDVTASQQELPNLLAIDFKAEQAAFLAGYVAANMSRTNKIGFIGGIEGEIVGRFDYGYQAGALYAKKDIQIMNQYAQNFFDVNKGRGIAELMLQNGADVIFHAAGPTGRGMIECVREKQLDNEKKGLTDHVWAIGVDRDEYKVAPEVVLTSVLKRVDNAVFSILEDIKEQRFKGKRTIVLGLEGDYVGLSDTSSVHVPAQLLDKTESLKQQIINGNICVPANKSELERFKQTLQDSTF